MNKKLFFLVVLSLVLTTAVSGCIDLFDDKENEQPPSPPGEDIPALSSHGQETDLHSDFPSIPSD